MMRKRSRRASIRRRIQLGLERLEPRHLLAGGVIDPDRLEPNDTANAATLLGRVSGLIALSGLSLHTAADDDWFEFELAVTGGPNDYVRVDSDVTQGDVDVVLFDVQSGLEIGMSRTSANREEISLQGFAPGVYRAVTFGRFVDSVSPEYSFSIHAPLAPDAHEPNETRATSANLNRVEGQRIIDGLSIHQPGDADWFRFETSLPGQAGHFVRIDFVHALGDVDLWFYNAQGTLIGQSLGVSNREEISLAGLPAGVYYAEIEGFQEATNPSYKLTLNAPGLGAGDAFEPNNVRGSATDLHGVGAQGQFVGDNLSIHAADDEDWYRFDLPANGGASDFVRLDFTAALGDLDVRLHNDQGAVVAGSFGVGDREEISLAGREAGTYFVQVYGFLGDTNPYYRLRIEAVASSGPARDSFEANDSPASATDLGAIAGQQTWGDLSIHPAGDEDWFRFQIGPGATAGHLVQAGFRHDQGDVDLELYAADGVTRIAVSETTTDSESVALAGLGAGTYLLRVYGYQGAMNPDYALTIDAPGISAGDRYEPNNAFGDVIGTSADLGPVAGPRLVEDLSLHTADDSDWFRFEIGPEATLGHGALIVFRHAEADLTLQLAAADGHLLQQSTTTADYEIVSFTGLAAGAYFLRVLAANGQAAGYTLLVNGPGSAASAGDRYEPNNTAVESANLGLVTSQKRVDRLSVHAANEDDWFSFQTAATAGPSHSVSIAFGHLQGDLDLELYGDGETPLRISNGTTDVERIALEGLPAGTYRVRIYGYQGALNPAYELTIVGPQAAGGLTADRFEAPSGNNAFASATDLGRVDTQFVAETLSIHTAGDDDWYRFTMQAAAGASHFVQLTTSHQRGDLDIELYDDQQNLLAASRGVTDLESISLDGRRAGSYYLRVFGYSDAVNPDYALRIAAPSAATATGAARDPLEGAAGNDEPERAHVIGQVAGAWSRPDLSIHAAEDEDWFRFQTTEMSHNRHGAGVVYDPSQGDLQLELYTENGALLAVSQGGPGLEGVSLADRPAGVYLLRVYALAGVAPRYALSLSVPLGAVQQDWSEGPPPNDLAAAATDLGEIAGFWSRGQLSLHSDTDEDWFRFTTPADRNLAPASVLIGFDRDEGNLDLQLYDAAGTTLLGQSSGTSHLEQVGLPAIDCHSGDCRRTYLVRVSGSANPDYILSMLPAAAATGAAAASIGPAGQTRTGEILPDQFEGAGNNSSGQATQLGLLRGVIEATQLTINTQDEDWFRFQLVAPGSSEHQVAITFDHLRADLDMELFAGDGSRLIRASRGVASSEQISLADQPSGEYLLRVYAYRGAAPYALTIQGPSGESGLLPDSAEPNDSRDSAHNLGVVSGTVSRESLCMQSANDDWFRFETLATGGTDHTVQIAFDHDAGDLDLELFDAANQRLERADGTSNRESLSLAGRPAGVYYVRAYGYDGAENPRYQLTVAAPRAPLNQIPRDAFEPNNTRSQPRDLGRLLSPLVRRQLSIESGDEDWFRLETAATGGQLHSVGVNFDRSLGSLQVELYDGSGQTLLATSRGISTVELVSLRDRPAGTYLVRVAGRDGSTHSDYALIVSPPPAASVSIAPDRTEPNDSRQQAYDLRQAEAQGGQRCCYSLPVGLQGDLNQLYLNGTLGYADFPSNLTSPNATPYEFVSLGPGSVTGGLFAPGVGSSAAYQSGVPPLSMVLSPLVPHLGGFNVGQLIGNPNSAVGSAFASLAGTVGGGSIISSILGGVQTGFGGSNYGVGFGAFTPPPPPPPPPPLFPSYPSLQLPPLQPALPGLILPPWDPDFVGQQAAGGLGPSSLAPLLPPPTTSSGSQTLQQPATGDAPSETAAPLVNQPLARTFTGLSIHSSTDEDWFRFELTQPGRVGDLVRLSFLNQDGNLELELYDSSISPRALRFSSGNTDREEISLAGLARGTHFIRVFGAGGATNPAYTLEISAGAGDGSAPAGEGDAFEPNNSLSQPRDLRVVAGQRLVSGLSIEEGDHDWFRFELPSPTAVGHYARIDLTHSRGDLDLELYRASGGPALAQSTSTTDREQVPLENLEAGSYLLHVYGYADAANPSYVLTINTPTLADLLPDRFERPIANNARTSPSNLPAVGEAVVLPDLTLHRNDEDWFRIEMVGPGMVGHDLRVQFDGGAGDLRIELYGSGASPLRASQSATNYETLSLDGLAAGTYLARVYSPSAAQHAYQFVVNPPAPQRPDDWTIMVYMTASNLEDAAFEDINEMENMVSRLGGSVNFAVLWDQNSARIPTPNGQFRDARSFETPIVGQTTRQTWDDAGRAIILPDQSLVQGDLLRSLNRLVTPFERLGERNTGSADTLIEFVEWAMATAPAERYALILWDHGSGLDGTNDDYDPGGSGAGFDRLTTAELDLALTTLRGRGRDRLDLLGFDACLQAMTEVAHALSAHADVIVASQEPEGNDGWEYHTAFERLRTDPSASPTDLASSLIQSYAARYQSDRDNLNTLSAILTNRYDDLTTALHDFATHAASQATGTDWLAIARAAANAPSMSQKPDYRDLGNFMAQIQNNQTVTQSLRTRAGEVVEALQAAVGSRTRVRNDVYGLSIFLPAATLPATYTTPYADFLESTGWGDFLTTFQLRVRQLALLAALISPSRGGAGFGVRGPLHTVDWAEPNDQLGDAYSLHELVGAGHQFDGLALDQTDASDLFRFSIAAGAGAAHVVMVNYDPSQGPIRLELLDAGGAPLQPVRTSNSGNGQERVALDGLAAGEYVVAVTTPGDRVPYQLRIDAPASAVGSDWIAGNHEPDKAYDLGVVTRESVAAGLRTRATESDWYVFSTPRDETIAPGFVRVHAFNGDVAVTLQSADGEPVGQASGGGVLNIQFPSGSGAAYRLLVSTASNQAVPYTLNLANPQNTAPQLNSLTAQTAEDGQQLVIPLVIGDSEADTLTLEFAGDAPPGAEIDADRREIRWTPTEEQSPGSYQWLLRVTDHGTPPLSSEVRVDVSVAEHNDPPSELILDNATVRENLVGARIGNLTVRDPEVADQHSFNVSDDRFEVRDGSLWLKDAEFLRQGGGAAIQLSITATDSGTPPQGLTQQVTIGVLPHPHPWHNERQPLDADNNGFVVPLDVLLLINELNEPSVRNGFQLPATRRFESTQPFYDVEPDGLLVPLDVLLVINFLNDPSGEGEPGVVVGRDGPAPARWNYRAPATGPASTRRLRELWFASSEVESMDDWKGPVPTRPSSIDAAHHQPTDRGWAGAARFELEEELLDLLSAGRREQQVTELLAELPSMKAPSR